MGKATRTSARDATLSWGAKQIGRGWGFGLLEALDQIGAVIGPLSVAVVFHFRGGYCLGFSLLLISGFDCVECALCGKTGLS
jgi:hypothetical protein